MHARPAIAAMRRTVGRRSVLPLLAGIGIMLGDDPARAQRAARLIVTSSPGSATDATARALQSGIAPILGMPVVVENIPGASGLVGLQALARAAPGDMTFAVIPNNLAILPSVMRSFPFDVMRDFTHIAMLASVPVLLVGNAARISAGNAAEFVAQLQRQPDELTFGSSGFGSAYHLATELFLDRARASARHIAFQGPGPMFTALLGGHIDFGAIATSIALPQVAQGRLRAFGAFTAERNSIAPGIPTFAELGFDDCVAEAWITLLGPKGMPSATVERMNGAVAAGFGNPEIRQLLAGQGSVIRVTTPEETQAMIRADLAKYASLARRIGLTPE